jgi:hypothetical protein
VASLAANSRRAFASSSSSQLLFSTPSRYTCSTLLLGYLVSFAPVFLFLHVHAFVTRTKTMATTLTDTLPDDRFKKHIAFDTVPAGEPTKNNAISLTLNVRHKGYQRRRRSRTFMVGVDEHAYSDYALQWLLDELVDDGDEIVCVRVMEKEIRMSDKAYQDDANAIMKGIVERNGSNRAVAIVLEYAVGKLHGTFQHLV